MRALKPFIGAAAAIGMALVVNAGAAAGTQQPSPQSVLATVVERGTLRVGLATFVPWAMRDRNGDLIGFEVDVAKKLAGDMGVRVEFVPTAWEGIIQALVAGRFDIIISGMSITPERALVVDFTRPYASSGYILLASSERADRKGLTALEAFNAPGITIAARRASTCAAAVREHFPKATLVYFDDDTLAYREATVGGVDAVCSTPPKAAFEIERHGAALRVVSPEPMSPTHEAFAIRKGDPEALALFSRWIREQEASGWLKTRHDYWFTTREWADMVGTD